MKEVWHSSRVGAETVVVAMDDQKRLTVTVAERPGGPILVCTPTEAAMLALSLSQASAVAGPLYQMRRMGKR